MQAKETSFFTLLSRPQQFTIPIYQRTYRWTLEKCDQLWQDIVITANSDTPSSHFIGSIVYIQKGAYQASTVPQLLVIDGQQRLTTLSLLIAALASVIKEKAQADTPPPEHLRHYYLLNSVEQGDFRFKLLLTQGDRLTLMRLVEERPLPEPSSVRIVQNFRFFIDQLRATATPLKRIYDSVAGLLLVDIALDRERDNPQLIFESLNSTGLELGQADLVRNFVLMNQEPSDQQTLYNDYWYPMEQSFGHSDEVDKLNSFIRDYLTLKTRRITRIDDVYSAFKVYALSRRADGAKALVADVALHSEHFVRIALGKDPDSELAKLFGDIRTLKVDVAYPFLLEVYDDFNNGLLTRADVLEILTLVESYVFRRVICGIATNSLARTFANLTRAIDKDNYLDSLKAVFMLMEAQLRFPTDDEFRRELPAKDIYSNAARRHYVLSRLRTTTGKREWMSSATPSSMSCLRTRSYLQTGSKRWGRTGRRSRLPIYTRLET
jgi:uncharacterized protein with ParB-like and HNH nuclease domain